MVDMDVVKDRVLKGAYVGVGTFAASFIEPLIEDNLQLGNMGTAVAQGAIGAGLSIGVDEFFQNPRSLPNDAVEYMGYGIQGNAWANLAEMTQTGQLAGNSTVTVSRSGGGSQTGQNVTVEEVERPVEQAGNAGVFQAEVG